MKILLIGPYAPHGQVGAIRIISLSRYLVEKGHNVTVFCLSENTLMKLDPRGLTASIPEGIRLATYDITLEASSIVKKNWINGQECRKALREVLLKEKFHVALISGGPFYTFHVIGELIKRKLPYVVDYRDLHLSSKDKRRRNNFKDKIKFWITFPLRYYQEASCVFWAKHVTVVAPEMKNNLKKFFGIKSKKITVAYNGFDDAVLADIIVENQEKDVFTVGYFGKLMYYNQEYTKMLFRVIEKINIEKVRVKFLHIGPENQAIADFFSENNMNGQEWYTCLGQMDYKEGIRSLANCDAFAVEYAYPEGPGTKIFDYIYLNKPVIGVLKKGISLEKLIQKFDNGFVCYDEKDIEKVLYNLLDGTNKKLINGDNAQELINLYSRSQQNKIIEKILVDVSKEDLWQNLH